MKENLYTPRCIRTFSGKYINVFEPTEEMIDIIDIAHSLSKQCRFGSHLARHYSVAQHCVGATQLIRGEYEFDALMHDASEAYLGDICKPIKMELTQYNEIENTLMIAIAKKFKFRWPMPKEVEIVDKRMLEIEWENLMINDKPDFICWDQQVAKDCFLETFQRIKK